MIVERGTSHETDLAEAPAGSGRHAVYQRMVRGNPDAYHDDVSSVGRALLEGGGRVAASINEFFFFGDERFLHLTGMDDVKVDRAAIALQSGSDLRALLDAHMVRLHQSGLVGFLAGKWVRGRREEEDRCDCRAEAASPLGFESLLLPALILCAGAAAAAAAAVAEGALWAAAKSCKRS